MRNSSLLPSTIKREGVSEIQSEPETLRQPVLVNIAECIFIYWLYVYRPVADVIPYHGIYGEAVIVILLHQAGAQHDAILCTLLRGAGRNYTIGCLRESHVIEIANIGKPYFMSKIPHAGLNRIVNFCFKAMEYPRWNTFPDGTSESAVKKGDRIPSNSNSWPSRASL